MTIKNFLVGTPVMLLCLVVQIVVVFWCVRYCTRYASSREGPISAVGVMWPLSVTMFAMMIAIVVQISLWGYLFVVLGEFDAMYPAIYHSGVNFTSLGYGDVVMKEWKLLGPLEAANGVLMMSLTAAALTAILQQVIRAHVEELANEKRR